MIDEPNKLHDANGFRFVSNARHSRRLPPNVKLLGWASFLNDVASEMVYPLLPQFLISALGGSRLSLGVVEGVADSVASLLKLWSGALSDRSRSRKSLVVTGYALAAGARPIIGVLQVPWHVLLARVSDRIGKGVRTAPRDAMIADATTQSGRGRAFGFQRGMDHLGAAVGPLLAATLLWAWPGELRTLFLLTLVPGLLVVALLLVGLREDDSDRRHRDQETEESDTIAKQRSAMRSLTLTPFDNSFKLYLVALVVFTLGNSTDAFLLVRAGELGVPTWQLPILWSVFHMIKSAGSIISGRQIAQVGPRALILTGWLVYGCVYLAFGFASTSWHVWALFVAYAVFYALTEPAERTLVANLVGSEHRGLAYGWFNLAVGISTLPASVIFGWLYDQFGSLTAFGWGAVLAIIASLLLAHIRTEAGPAHRVKL